MYFLGYCIINLRLRILRNSKERELENEVKMKAVYTEYYEGSLKDARKIKKHLEKNSRQLLKKL